MQFGIRGYDVLVLDVSLVYDRIGSSMQHGLKVKLHLGNYLHARARSKFGKFKSDHAAQNITLVPAILSVTGNIHPEFLQVMANMHEVKYSNLVTTKRALGVSISSGDLVITGI